MRGQQIILLLIASILPLAAQQTATVNGTLTIFKDQFVVKTFHEVQLEDDMQGKVSSTQVQLIGYGESDVPGLRSLVGKKVAVKGQLGAGFTRYHILPLIISMESIKESK
jgi:hypothetical protein